MLIPLLLFLVIVPATIEAKNLIRTSLVQTAENDLKANSQSVDSDLLRLVQQAQTMGKNINVTALTRLTNEEFEEKKLSNCHKMYILSEKNDFLLSQSLVSTDASKLYGTFFQVDGYTYEEWRDVLFQTGVQYQMLPATKANMVFDPAQLNSSDQVIHLVVPLSVSSGTADKVFVFMLDADAICSALRLDRYGEESWVAV